MKINTRCQDAQKVLSSAWPVPTVLAALDLSEVNLPHKKMGKLRTSADFCQLIRDIACKWADAKEKSLKFPL